MRLALALAAVLAAANPADGSTISVRDHGAKGDGRALDTAAINRAIVACARAGGGQVRFPAGQYRTATIHLKSGVHLWLEAGAVVVGDRDPERYSSFTPPMEAPESKFGARWHRALILGDGVEDASIQGPGVIDGSRVFDPRGEERMRGPHTILLGSSRRIALRDITIRDSANYAVMMEGCDDVAIHGLRVEGGWDGIHFRGWPGRPCRRIRITDCHLFTGDDAIAGRYWEDTLIAGCVLNSSCNGIRLIGPAARLVVHNCLFYGPGLHAHRTSGRTNMLAGLCLQPGAWDPTVGSLEQVSISQATMHNVTTPLFCVVKPGNTVRDIRVAGLKATGVYLTASSFESWAEAPIESVSLTDVWVEFRGDGGAVPPRRVAGPGVDARPLPAWGLYARRVGELRLAGVRFMCSGPVPAKALLCEEVGRLSLDGVRAPPGPGALDAGGAREVVARDVAPAIPEKRNNGAGE